LRGKGGIHSKKLKNTMAHLDRHKIVCATVRRKKRGDLECGGKGGLNLRFPHSDEGPEVEEEDNFGGNFTMSSNL